MALVERAVSFNERRQWTPTHDGNEGEGGDDDASVSKAFRWRRHQQEPNGSFWGNGDDASNRAARGDGERQRKGNDDQRGDWDEDWWQHAAVLVLGCPRRRLRTTSWPGGPAEVPARPSPRACMLPR